MTNATMTKPAVKRPRKMARVSDATPAEPKPRGAASAAVTSSPQPQVKVGKQDQLIAMLRCEQDASVAELAEALGWLPHTTRAALTGLRKKGHCVSSDKLDGVRRYRIIADKREPAA